MLLLCYSDRVLFFSAPLGQYSKQCYQYCNTVISKKYKLIVIPFLVLQINKMELQQHQQQQLLLSVDGYFDGSGTAKVLLSKVLSLAVSLFAIVLVVVSLVARIISPFTSTW